MSSKKITVIYDEATEAISIDTDFRGAVTIGILEIAHKLTVDHYLGSGKSIQTAKDAPSVEQEA